MSYNNGTHHISQHRKRINIVSVKQVKEKSVHYTQESFLALVILQSYSLPSSKTVTESNL